MTNELYHFILLKDNKMSKFSLCESFHIKDMEEREREINGRLRLLNFKYDILNTRINYLTNSKASVDDDPIKFKVSCGPLTAQSLEEYDFNTVIAQLETHRAYSPILGIDYRWRLTMIAERNGTKYDIKAFVEYKLKDAISNPDWKVWYGVIQVSFNEGTTVTEAGIQKNVFPYSAAGDGIIEFSVTSNLTKMTLVTIGQ